MKGGFSMVLEVIGYTKHKIFFSIVIILLSLKGYALHHPTCDQVPITVRMEPIGEIELPALICEDQLYLSIEELFRFLKIKIEWDNQNNTLEGFILNQKDYYLIDTNGSVINYNGKVYQLEDSDFRYEGEIYLNATYFQEVFGLKNDFNFRNLSLALEPEIELPFIKEVMRNKFRKNILNDLQIPVADTTITPDNPFFNFGSATWNMHATQRSGAPTFGRFNLGLAGNLLGGELSGSINLLTDQPLDSRNQFYRWRTVNNESRVLRQLTLGKIGVRSKASLFSPVIGLQMTNTPTYRKQSFGTYNLSDYTKPGWMVELYINHTLVDFTEADTAGFYSFEIPLLYGNTSLNLRFYGPYGEEEFSKKEISIPYNLQQKGHLEYDFSLGSVEETGALYGQSRFNFGLSPYITVGGGLEYLSSLENNQLIPYLDGTFRLNSQIIMSGEYLPGVGYKATLNYRYPGNYHLDLFYAKYQKGQNAILYNYNEERSAVVTVPVKIGRFTTASRLALRQTLVGANNFSNIEWLLRGNLFGMSSSIQTRAYFNQWTNPKVYSRLTLSQAFPNKLIVSPQIEYNYQDNQISSIRGEVSKRIFKDTYFRTTLEHNFTYNQFSLNFGINLGLGFSRLGLSSSISDHHNSFSQVLSGGLTYSREADYISLDERSILGMANVKFLAFLDTNGNGLRDKTEPEIRGLEVNLRRGGIKRHLGSGATIFTGLEPYIPYFFTFNSDHLENIAWSLATKSISITLNPNQLKLIEVPINVVGEVSGYIRNGPIGIGGIRMHIEKKDGTKMASITSENDGFFNFYGLPSGSYEIQADSKQLLDKGLKTENTLSFDIQNGEDGDYVDNLLINLGVDNKKKEVSDTPISTYEFGTQIERNLDQHIYSAERHQQLDTGEARSKDRQSVDKPNNDSHSFNQKEEIASTGSLINHKNSSQHKWPIMDKESGIVYSIQILTTKKETATTNPIFNELYDVSYYTNNGMHSYIWGKTTDYEEALLLRQEMLRKGILDAFVVCFHNGQRISHSASLQLIKLRKK